MPVQNLDERAIFLAAVEAHAPDEWPAFLDVACGDDDAFRQRVEALLAAHGKYNEMLDGAGLVASLDGAPSERLGMQIGPYTLLEQIGEGGFGIVYMAEQVQPVRRRVALKVIKPGMDSHQVIARFEAERQALAVMDHPHIAKVLDAGTTESGRPYFVMELVLGTPITEYCDENSLTIRQRLELFAAVCRAIQHAHTKGIIHRDIKPTNVLVAEYDKRQVAKVIDFGVAKAVGPRLTEKTMFTECGQLLGTLEYMSPEQARLNQLDIDTRSDVYSLGVLLYELLTGTTPLNQSRLLTLAFDETLRIIREDEPPRPSTLLLSGDTLASVAASRNTEPARLSRAVRGELDWIVMKALDKDRNRRYETAVGLALDVERHLRDEPVLACPPSTWYRLRKLARRKKGVVFGGAAAVLALVLAVVALVTSNFLIRREQARTTQEKVRAEKAQKLAEGRAEEVRQGLARLKAANDLLDRGRWYVEDRSWDDAHEAFSQAIELHADHVSLWVQRGDLYTRLGLWDLAAADFAREMELHEPETTFRWLQHALLRRAVGDDEGCRQAARRMRERFTGSLKAKFLEEMVRSSLLVPDPEVDLPALIELCREAAPSLGQSMPYVLGTAHYRAGQYDKAIEHFQEAPAKQPQWAIALISYPAMAMAHHRLGHEAQARQALDEAARIRDQWIQHRYAGQGHYPVIHPGGDANWPAPWWDYLEFELQYTEARLLIDGSPPPADPRLHVLRGRALAGLNWVEKAAAEFEAALALKPDDAQIRVEFHRNRGGCCVHRRQWHHAAAEFAKAVEIRPDDAYLWRFQAVAYFAAEDADAYRQTCTAMLERFGGTEDRLAAANVLTACVLRDDALSDMQRLVSLARVSDPNWHWGAGVRGAALYRAGRYDECAAFFEKAAKTYRPRAWDWCFKAMAQHRLGRAAEARQSLTEARRWIDAASRHSGDDPSGTQPVWGGWHEPVVARLLVEEAEELLKKKSEVGNRKVEFGSEKSELGASGVKVLTSEL